MHPKRGDKAMRVKVRDDVDGIHASTLQAGVKLHDLIEPALARGEEVVLDFEGVKYFAPMFFNCAIGTFIERDAENRLFESLRFENLSALGQLSLDHVIEYATRRRENPRGAGARDAAAWKRPQEAWEGCRPLTPPGLGSLTFAPTRPERTTESSSIPTSGPGSSTS